jgi:hypothetical protein
MRAIREIVDTHKLRSVVTIPKTFGDKVELIVLPVPARKRRRKKHTDLESDTTMLMEMQECSGYIRALLDDPDEDVWNAL